MSRPAAPSSRSFIDGRLTSRDFSGDRPDDPNIASLGGASVPEVDDQFPDRLSLDRPVQIALQPSPSLVQRGQATLIPIHYGTPLRLEFSGIDAQPVYATNVLCSA